MPIHDCSRVPSGLFHHFHQDWSIELARTLNRGLLPSNLSALVEQRAGVVEPDVPAIEDYAALDDRETSLLEANAGRVATMQAPTTRILQRSADEIYADRANRIVIRHHLGRIVAMIEIVSPGNKDKRGAIRSSVEKTVDSIQAGVHVLIIDLFPPTVRDPKGLHKLIWDEIADQPFELPPGSSCISSPSVRPANRPLATTLATSGRSHTSHDSPITRPGGSSRPNKLSRPRPPQTRS